MAFEDYDISKAFERIEDELISSMMRNLRRHLQEEDKLEFDWSQWQVEQLRYLQEYRKRNKKKFGPQFKEINKKVVEAIRDAAERGGKDEEKNILKQLTGEKAKPRRRRGEASVEGAGDAFFRINDKKLEALVKAANDDLTRAEHAVLRRSNDQYRKIIYDAQVYANTGAGTIEQAIDMATKDFLSRGIDCIEYKNGARHTIKDYADMYIRTAERRAYLMGEGSKRQEWSEELVIVNKRGGHPCLQCIPWLGKVLIDDVYSGGKPDGKHKLLSEAMDEGFLHPRCKDGFTTYFPGISSAPDPDAVTKKELKKAVKAEKEEARESYAQRQAEKYNRLAEHSMDPENKEKYRKKAEQWEEKAERLKAVEEPQAVPAKVIDLEHQKEIDEALEYYVSGEGMYVNEHLAGLFEENGGVWTEEDEELLKLLDEGTQEDVKEKKLWRSVDASAVFGDISSSEFWDLQSYITYGESSLTPDRAAKIKKLLSVDGSEITEPRLMSTTKDKQIALDWGSFSGSDKPIVLELDVPEGIKGADLERFDLPDDPQKEVLLARGQRYRIKSIGSEDGQIVVKAELIPEEIAEVESGRLARKAKQKSERESLQEVLRNSITIGNPYVEPTEIQSLAFRQKFKKLTDDSKINDRIRTLAQGNLTKNNGTYTEMLDIIDLDTGSPVIHKLGKKNGLEVALTAEERAAVRAHKGRIIGIHNHPTNIFPTGSDFVVAGARGYEFGLVITHDLRVFKYTPPKAPVDAITLDRIIEKYTRMLYDDTEKRKGFEKAMQELERRFGITWQEM